MRGFSTAPLVHLSPPSLLIPENESVVFTCEVVYNGGYTIAWYNETKVIGPDQQGFIQEFDYTNDIHKIKFNATHSLKINGTSFSCLISDTDHLHHNISNRSNAARLLVLNSKFMIK